MAVEAQPGKIFDPDRNAGQNCGSNCEFNSHRVTAPKLVLSSDLRENSFRQCEQSQKFFLVSELAKAATVFLCERFASWLQILTEIPQVIDGLRRPMHIVPSNCLQENRSMIHRIIRLIPSTFM